MKEINQDTLQKMAVPTVSMKSHQVHLKQALLAASRPPQQTIKQRWSNLVTKPKFIASSASMAFAVLAIVAISAFTLQRPVSAAALTEQSLNKVSKLSPGEYHELDLRVAGDPKSELEAAKNAKDLKVMTYNEYAKEDAQGGIQQLPGAQPDESLKSLKYLRYTDSDGAVHTIGVDKKGLPVIIMVSRQNKDGSSEGMVRVGGEGSGPLIGSMNGPKPEGMTTCSASVDGGAPTCTNSDGSTAPAPNCQTSPDGGMMCSASGSAQIKEQ